MRNAAPAMSKKGQAPRDDASFRKYRRVARASHFNGLLGALAVNPYYYESLARHTARILPTGNGTPMGTVRPSRKLRTKADFLIIGGGWQHLRPGGDASLGYRRDLPGGHTVCLAGVIRSVRNRRIANYPIELGAEFVHGSAMKQLCESLGLTLIKHPSDGAAFVDNEFLPLVPILQAFKRIREQAAAHLAAGKDDRSVEEFLAALADGNRDLPPGVTSHLLLQLIRNDFAARVSDLGLTGLLAPEVDGYEDNYRVAEGYAEVPGGWRRGAMFASSRNSGHFQAPRSVDVFTNRGVYSGNVAVACLPGVSCKRVTCGLIPRSRAPRMRRSIQLIQELPPSWCCAFAAPGEARPFGRRRCLSWRPRWRRNSGGRPDGIRRSTHFPGVLSGRCAAVVRFAERDPRQVGLAQLAHMFGRERVERKCSRRSL